MSTYKESGKRKYDEILGRISQTTTLADARDCDLIIEVGPQTPCCFFEHYNYLKHYNYLLAS